MSEIDDILNEIYKPNCNIISLLRRTHIFALKNNLVSLDHWVKKELDGYSMEEEVPEYRVQAGILQALSIDGWIDAFLYLTISDEIKKRDLCTKAIRFSLPRLLTMLPNNSDTFFVMLPDDMQQELNKEAHSYETLEFAVHYSQITVNDIVEKVKTRLAEQIALIELQEESGSENRKSGSSSSKKISGDESGTIFISHRSVDKEIAVMLQDFFISVNVPRHYVFCSDLPGNDVKEKIRPEIKSALQKSILNITILSDAYYQSVYCQNEAGILWYLSPIPVIPIALPEMIADKMTGFLNKDYKLRRLDNTEDIAYIYDAITDALNIKQESASVINTESKKLIKKYTDYIAKRDIPQSGISGAKDIKQSRALGITITEYEVHESSPCKFSVVFTNQADKTFSVYEKYLHFYKGGQEVKKQEVSRFEVQHRKDALDELNVLVAVNGIITLEPGHAERAGIIMKYDDVKVADRVVFTCIANQEEYEVLVYSKEE